MPKSANEVLRAEPGVPPPKRSRKARSQTVVFLNFIMSILVMIAIGAGLAAYFGKRQFDAPGPTADVATFVVKRGSGVAEVASQLENRNLISDARIFRYGAKVLKLESALKAGEYEFKAGASMRDILASLSSGKSVLHSLTIPEGLTVMQILARIGENEVLAGDMPAEVPAEGSLLADTQRFSRGTTRAEIIQKLMNDQKKLVEDIWARRQPNLPVKDINEFVTLASIVEKETGKADERPRVAGVFINRLNKGMRLQSDPTIIYGIYGGRGKPADVPIRKSDLEKQTPYNTYQIDGLPPTPIANPGKDALEAVANPSQTEDLFFVADGTGGHVFAATLEEHNENVVRWRKVEAKAAEDAKKAQDAGAAAPAEPATAPVQ
ncbi:MAG: endolytic transglycosylase MltG [Rhizobiaceae bacterium]